ncbi:MAG: M20/M25/M40 family metallo-hydrolase [Candidatus Cloacimonadaceae bacterium]|nr:M20/M25/M40 family metallo-hydrolase [Candidatus Cloacimonadaceae bacterium]
MKNLVLMLILAGLLFPLSAGVNRIVAIGSDSARKNMGDAKLYDAAHGLSLSGAEIYYYNENYIVAGLDERFETMHKDLAYRYLAAAPMRLTLFLVSRLDIDDPLDLSTYGRVLLDLGTSLLLQSDLNEVELRARIHNPFTILDTEPMRFQAQALNLSVVDETRTSISQMISHVNADSVLSFIQSLQDFQTRYAFASNRLQVAQWIQQQFIRMGVADAQLHQFIWQNTQQYNVVATIPGSVYPDQYIIVGGHHDSISNNSDPMLLAPGADDNASGTVAALEMARVILSSGYQPKCSIRFVTFAAEEFGLWGAKAYSAYAQATDMNIRLMMNHDMIANSNENPQTWRVRLMPYDGSLDHSAYASTLTQQYTTLNPVYGSLNSGSSDSHPFWQRGYNVIYFFEYQFCPYYHTSNDITANLNPVYCAEVIKASAAVAATFADMPGAPSNLSVLDAGSGNALYMSWQGYNDASLSHYNVYFSTTMGQWGTPVTTTNWNATISGLTQGQLYYVAVSSEDVFGNESYLIYGAGVPYSIPLTPHSLTDVPSPDSIVLSWNPNTEMDLAGYNIYRSNSSETPGSILNAVPFTGVAYPDNDVVGSLSYYYYRVAALDMQGNSSPLSVPIRSRPVSLNQGILIVDETKNLGGSNPFQPTDEQVDNFYAMLMNGFDVHHFDTESTESLLRLGDIGIYSSILWHGNDLSDMDYPYTVRNALLSYLSYGGNIMFSLYQPTLAFDLNSGYPATFPANNYLNYAVGIGSVNYSTAARFKYANPLIPGFPPLQVDSLKTTSSLNGHILRVEGIHAAEGAQNVYSYGSDYANSSAAGLMNGSPIAVLKDSGNGKIITLSFPLYNMQGASARALTYHVFTNLFNEASPNDDQNETHISPVRITASYPNPFSDRTSIAVKIKDGSIPINVSVYNLRGQQVREVFDGKVSGNHEFVWDGRDRQGNKAATGIYFVRVSQARDAVIRKVMLIRN